MIVPSEMSKRIILACKREVFSGKDILEVLRGNIAEWTALNPEQVTDRNIYDLTVDAIGEVLDRTALTRFLHDIVLLQTPITPTDLIKQMASALILTRVRDESGEILIDLGIGA